MLKSKVGRLGTREERVNSQIRDREELLDSLGLRYGGAFCNCIHHIVSEAVYESVYGAIDC